MAGDSSAGVGGDRWDCCKRGITDLFRMRQLLPDRALPNAPPWQAAVSATYRDPRGPFARVDVTGMGGYYFDLPPNSTTSQPYGLVNGRLGWETQRWAASLWGRNLLDKKYPVRGFYFSDTPQDSPRSASQPALYPVG